MTVAQAQPAAENGNKQETSGKASTTMKARSYQLDLISVATNNNVIISLATGAGKTLIAAEVIRRKLPELKAQKKAVVFLAPTNPLVAQQCDVALGGTHGFIARAYHGAANHHHMSSWDRARWESLVDETDVFVMTPDVLLHTLSHGVFRMSDIGLLIFDEAHHCKSDHPYNQLLQDFYHPLDPSQRPQILGLTASPDGVEPDGPGRRRKGRPLNPGLQHNMNAYLITVPAEGPLRSELSAAVPWPSTQLLTYQAVPAIGVIADSLTWLNWMKERLLRPAKRCEQICEMLRRQELLASAGYMEAGLSTDVFEGFAEGGRVSALDKQIRGVLYCLENLGPWCAAAAAYLDLLAPPEEAEVEGELMEEQLDDPIWSDEDEDEDRSSSDDSDDPGLPVMKGGDNCRIFDDELGGPPELLLQELRHLLGGIVDFLQLHAEDPNLSFIITPDKLTEATTPRPQDLPAAAAAAEATRQISEAQMAGELGGLAMGGMGTCAGGNELEWCARGILRLSCRVALLITMNVLADVLVDDKELKQQLMTEAGGISSSASPHLDSHARGSLQGFAEVLLRRVPFSLLEAQIWPELYTSKPLPPWHGPALLTHKVITLLRLLNTDRQRCIKETADRAAAAAAGGGQCSSQVEDWWASMVFVETKLSALVLSKLLSTLPHMRLVLRSGYLLGDTRNDGTAGGLAMNNKQQAQVVAGFRTSAINTLIATSVGSEGMDFKQCQLVVAFDLPRDVTSYIQCRGRGRKAGSKYCFMQQEEHKDSIMGVIRRADRLEARVREISTQNRKLLEQHRQRVALAPTANGGVSAKRLELRGEPEPIDHSSRLMTGVGAVVTLRLAQQMLAEYCAKLPGSDRSTPLQAYYSTRVSGGLFHSIVYLPSNAGMQTKVEDAPPGLSSKQAKQHAALRVLRLLYQAGKLNEHLQPVWITQKHHKQLEAEAIPNLTSELRIRSPLHPRPLAPAWQQQQQHHPHSAPQQQQQQSRPTAERTLVLHLHTFIYSKPKQASSEHPQNLRASAAAAADPVAEQQRLAEFSLLSAVVGSDYAVAALPGGPTVTGDAAAAAAAAAGGGGGSRSGDVSGRLCWGVLLWERLTHDKIMQWPVWIDKQLYVMDVEYVGPEVLSDSQVNRLLGYQGPLNRHLNWDTTRAEWLKTARELDKQEAEAAAAATAAVDTNGSVAAAMEVDHPESLAASSSSHTPQQQPQQQQQQQQQADKQDGTGPDATPSADVAEQQQKPPEEQVQRQPILPFKPDLLKGLMHWGRGQQQQQQYPAAAAAASSSEAQESWSPPDRLSYLIVPITSSSSSSTPTAAAAAPGNGLPDLTSVRSPVGDPEFENNISNLGDSAGDLADQMAGAASSAAAAAAAADPGSSSGGKPTPPSKIKLAELHQIKIDWSVVGFMASGLIPLSHYLSQHLGLPRIPDVPADRIELPPPIPPEPVPESVVAAAAAAGEPVPLKGAAAMAAVHPRITHAQVLALEQNLKGRVVVAGHSSHVYTALGIAGGLTPGTSLSESIMKLANQLGVTNDDDQTSNPAADGISHPGGSGAPPTAGFGHTASSAADLSTGNKISNATGVVSSSTGGNPATKISPAAVMTNLSNSWAALLSSKNPDLAAAVMLSSSMMQHDPDQRPMLGWKVGKTDQGSPIWESVDRHDDYYRIRSGITGLRSDLPMLAVKSSRGLTDSCLLPPKELKNVISMPAAAAAALEGSEPEAAAGMEIDGVSAAAAASAAAGSNVAHKRPASEAVAGNGSIDTNGPDKRRRVRTDGDITTAAAEPSPADPQLQQQPDNPCFTTHELPTPEALSAESAQLAHMSRSGRKKVWAQHRVMFLPLELVWLLPITSSSWSQLQLIPNIIYRLDSMLQAVGMHDWLRKLLHGASGAAAAAAAAKMCDGPDREDLQTAAADGWQQPAAMYDLMSGVSNRELLSQQDDLRPDDQAGASKPDSQAAAAVSGPEGQAAAAAGGSSVDQGSPPAAAVPTHKAVDTGVANGCSTPTAPKNSVTINGTGAAAAAAVSGISSVWRDVPLPSPTLLLVSMTASSCQETFDLERLEFLGDVILKVLSSHVLIKAFPPDANEGELSVAKARIIRNLRLAQLGRSAPLYLQYQLRSFPYDNSLWTPTGTQSVLGLFENGRNYTCKGKRIADGVESLIGAFYLAGAAKEAALKATAAANGSGSAEDVTSWVWHRVSRGGLVAAAAFCEAVGVLPKGAARHLTGAPMSLSTKDRSSSDINSLSLLHPSYSNYYRAKLGSIAASGAADGGGTAAGFKVTLADKLAERYASRAKKLPAGPLPYTFRDPAWLLQSLTHVSVLGCPSYQRLEFLGDSLMDLLVSLRTLSAGRQHHLDPAALTKARAKSVSNQMMATAAVMSGLHLMLHANSWRLLVGVRRFARETLTLYGKQPVDKNEPVGDGERSGDLFGTADAGAADKSATAAAIRFAANAGILSRAAIAAEAAGASKESVLAAAAAAASKAVAEAAVGALGASAAALANRLSQDVLDDDTLWMAVWVRKKELAALQAAAAKAAKEAAAKATAAGEAAGASNTSMGDSSTADPAAIGAAGVSSSSASRDAAAAAGSDEIAKELEQHMAAAAAEAAAEAQATKRKFPKVLADLIESLIAAVYVDSSGDWEATWAVGEYLLCQHQEEVERIEAEQQQQPDGAKEAGVGSESDDEMEEGSDDLLTL